MEIAIGSLVSLIAPYAAYALLAVVIVMAARLPAPILNAYKQLHLDKLIVDAIRFGVNSVEGAAAGKALSVGVANPVVALAVRYAVDHASPFLQSVLGDPEKLAEKIWAQLNLDPAASMPDFSEIVKQANV